MVGMHDRPANPEPTPVRHLQGIDDKVGGHPGRDRPADRPAGERVENDSAVDLALTRVVFGDVGEPQLVGPRGGEVPVDPVFRGRGVGFAPLLLPLHAARPAVLAHDSFDPFAADPEPVRHHQLGTHPGRSIGVEERALLDPQSADHACDAVIFTLPGGRLPAAELIETRF
jgi:hypothetical protein